MTLQLRTEWKGAPAEETADAKTRRLVGRSEGRPVRRIAGRGYEGQVQRCGDMEDVRDTGRSFIPWPVFVEAGRHCQNLLAKAEGGVRGLAQAGDYWSKTRS